MKKSEILVCKQDQGFLLQVYEIVGGYSGVISDSLHKLWQKNFTCPEKAQTESLAAFSSILLTDEYLSLSEKYYKESQYYLSIENEKEADAYMKKAFFYKEKYHKSKGLQILSQS